MSAYFDTFDRFGSLTTSKLRAGKLSTGAPRTVSARPLIGAHLQRLKATGVFDADQRRMIGVLRDVKERTLGFRVRAL